MERCARLLVLAALIGAASVSASHADAGAIVAPARASTAPVLLGTLGTVSGSNVYTTFIAMGAVADGWVRKTYAADKAAGIARTLGELAASAASGLAEVLSSVALTDEDRTYVRGIVAAYGLLADEARAFVSWVDTGERAAFDRARAQAWALIEKGIELTGEEALE